MVLSHPGSGVDGVGGLPNYPRYAGPPWIDVEAFKDKRIKTVQLFGLDHCVRHAFERVFPEHPNKMEKYLEFGFEVGGLSSVASLRMDNASIEVETKRGVLRVVGHPAAVEELFARAVKLLSEALPALVQWVDMVDNGTLRRLSTGEEIEAMARAGGVAKEQVKLAPMWHKTRMLVQLLVPGGNQQAMERVCLAIRNRVMKICERNVSVYVGPIAINKSTTVRPRKRAANGVSKEHQHVFIVGLSEAVGVDLWLDGHFVRGEVDDTAAREGCQTRLEEQKSILLQELGIREEEATVGMMLKPPRGKGKPPLVAFGVHYRERDLPVLEGFLAFFRACFGEDIVRDSEKSMVSVVERGDCRTTESVARYLEHGLRVCREEGVKPCDFSLLRARSALTGETEDADLHVFCRTKGMATARSLCKISDYHGICADLVPPTVLKFSAPSSIDGGGGDGAGDCGSDGERRSSGLPEYSGPPWADVDTLTSKDVKVFQLWGLSGSVGPAFDHLVSQRTNRPVNRCLELGSGAGDLSNAIPDNLARGATVKLEDGGQVVHVAGQRAVADKVFCAVAKSLSEVVPDIIQAVDMKSTGAMRIMATSHAVQEMARAGGADVDEIKMFLVWLEKSLVVQMTGGNEGKLQAMCQVLRRAVRQWRAQNVSVELSPMLVSKAAQRFGRNAVAGGVKDIRYRFVETLSEAVGVDLWLDGLELRGQVVDACGQASAQAKLETEMGKMSQDLGVATRLVGGEGLSVETAKNPIVSSNVEVSQQEAQSPKEAVVERAVLLAQASAHGVGGPLTHEEEKVDDGDAAAAAAASAAASTAAPAAAPSAAASCAAGAASTATGGASSAASSAAPSATLRAAPSAALPRSTTAALASAGRVLWRSPPRRNPAQVQEGETNGKQPDKGFEQQQDKNKQQQQQQDCHAPEPDAIFRVTDSSAVDPPQSTLSHKAATNNASIVAVRSQNRASAPAARNDAAVPWRSTALVRGGRGGGRGGRMKSRGVVQRRRGYLRPAVQRKPGGLPLMASLIPGVPAPHSGNSNIFRGGIGDTLQSHGGMHHHQEIVSRGQAVTNGSFGGGQQHASLMQPTVGVPVAGQGAPQVVVQHHVHHHYVHHQHHFSVLQSPGDGAGDSAHAGAASGGSAGYQTTSHR
ncbi:unnamed protein product [Ectocarpus sp. 12 AP-2014]